jgi:hypothetical protein
MVNYENLPLFPLHAVLFPRMFLPLHIFEERYKIMIARCLERHEPFGVVLIRQGAEVESGRDEPVSVHSIGTIARIQGSEMLDGGRFYVVVRGESRFEIVEEKLKEPYLTARIRLLDDEDPELADDLLDVQLAYDQACLLFREYVQCVLSGSRRQLGAVQLPDDPELLSYAIGATLQVTLGEKQKLLEVGSCGERLRREVSVMRAESETLGYLNRTSGAPGPEDRPDEPDRDDRIRTILRVDPSYTQDMFSKN